jgi:hypothetical protein
MVDADRTTIRKRQLQRLYADELRRARSISSRLVEGKQNGPVWACDASVYDCTRAFEGDVLLVGDAASFVEALSSGGVKKALSSAWTAAVVVNTCLATPSMRAAAFELHDRRERHVFSEYARRSAAFFREAASVYDNPFWSSRASARGPIVNDCGPSDLDLQRDADLRRTYEQLRDASGLDLVAGQRLRLEETAVIEGREVVLREGVVVPGWNVPLRFVAGINLPELIRAAVACSDIPSLLTTYHRLVSVADPRDLLTALSLLVTRGVLSRYSPTT